MTVFADFAAYYDLFYRDKAYREEVDYLLALIRTLRPDLLKEGSGLLELGAGTGNYTYLFAESGFDTVGLELSERMIEIARKKGGAESGPCFVQGDIQSFDLGKTFPLVMSFFHVISYINSDSALTEAFKSISAHLEPDGLFLFDCWYGPGVLTDLPARRIRRLKCDGEEIIRIAEPCIDWANNVVHVDYDMVVQSLATGDSQRFSERHNMRYLFEVEVRRLFDQAGLAWVGTYPWRSMQQGVGEVPSWYQVFVGRKVGNKL